MVTYLSTMECYMFWGLLTVTVTMDTYVLHTIKCYVLGTVDCYSYHGYLCFTLQVVDVYEFIKALPGCAFYADEFRSQEIDGQALMLLKEDHLMTTMSMKLGPALKICAKINSLKEGHE